MTMKLNYMFSLAPWYDQEVSVVKWMSCWWLGISHLSMGSRSGQRVAHITKGGGQGPCSITIQSLYIKG